MTAAGCPDCAGAARAGYRYCESCGRELGVRKAALPVHDPVTVPQCPTCGERRYEAGLCVVCRTPKPVPDRFEEDLGPVYILTDRGISHSRNEDAVAAAVRDGDGVRVIVVSDGVSTSQDPQAASGTAARTGVDAVLAALADGRPAPDAVMAGLATAVAAVRGMSRTPEYAPSCTYVSAILRDTPEGTEITVANVGDSRAFWLAAGDPTASRRLSVDDSWAQALVDAGAMDEEAAMRDPRAHTLLRWLGADGGEAPWSANCLQSMLVTEPGTLLLCTDGLWNYLPDPVALAGFTVETTPQAAARALADFALDSGGSDNITVALAPVPARAAVPDPGVS
ncbi:protein phosphatase 2C domain-containing protein [Nocardia rosealba]|uniref:PP2C family protein-serine/threonine phosphatase n=1 Tax=Nocardia TaxID=1817 RepID=UPI001CDA2A44|nr:protein phosphatase 2C domain-containing protein [Nocardia rosealba]MCA2208026.1 protein phosphatase 2C domain-containing protein [Nocardia rosealba]